MVGVMLLELEEVTVEQTGMDILMPVFGQHLPFHQTDPLQEEGEAVALGVPQVIFLT
jgi:hypothetical protein